MGILIFQDTYVVLLPLPWDGLEKNWNVLLSGLPIQPVATTIAIAIFPELLQALKRGVIAAGGLPMEFPTISLGEVFLAPTSLMFRNLMSIDTEEMIRAQPMDSVVLMGGCDKTLPAQLMGACSANLPTIALIAGPMITSRFQGDRLGACTDCRRFWARYRAGEIPSETIDTIESRLATTCGNMRGDGNS